MKNVITDAWQIMLSEKLQSTESGFRSGVSQYRAGLLNKKTKTILHDFYTVYEKPRVVLYGVISKLLHVY